MINQKHLTSLICTTADFGSLGAGLLHAGSQVRFRAQGSSMHPLVRDGDTLLISPLLPGGVRLGDIVLCTTDSGQALVHRVIGRRRGDTVTNYLVQGDQGPRPDAWITQQQIHGCLVEIERDGHRLQMTRPAIRFLGQLMVLAQRLGLRRSFLAVVASNLLKRSPGFSGYLK
jgi:signal peptidase I